MIINIPNKNNNLDIKIIKKQLNLHSKIHSKMSPSIYFLPFKNLRFMEFSIK